MNFEHRRSEDPIPNGSREQWTPKDKDQKEMQKDTSHCDTSSVCSGMQMNSGDENHGEEPVETKDEFCRGDSSYEPDHSGGTLSAFGTTDLATLHFLRPQLLAEPFSRDIFLIKLYVAGCGHIDDFPDQLERLRGGQKLTLLREPDNPYDEMAILVLNDGVKLGYVPRRNNTIPANLMDAGKYLYATVDDILDDPDDPHYPWEALAIKIYMKD